MKLTLKTPVIAAVTAAMLGLSGGVWADGGGRHHGGYGYYGKHGNQHYNRYEPRRHYYRSHGHGHDDDSDELFIGLLMGGLVGYAIGGAQQPNVQRYEAYPPASAAPPVAYPPQVVYPAPQAGYNGNDTCLQEREYQTQVMIGGKQVEAYGTACLQPDGSWRRGPAQAAAY
jgi:surface antigen